MGLIATARGHAPCSSIAHVPLIKHTDMNTSMHTSMLSINVQMMSKDSITNNITLFILEYTVYIIRDTIIFAFIISHRASHDEIEYAS